MLNNLLNTNSILKLGSNLYLTDFLDIFIIAVILYTVLIFLRRTRTYPIILGLGFALGIYLLSQIFNLYLTFITLRYFVSVSLIMFVIIFQSEIRKYFEFLGFIGSRRIKVGPFAPKSPATSEIIHACVKMAQDKIGALIVIQGKDNLDTLVDGGVPLDGVISEDVILSIFDPHSEGHDGAMIISRNRIDKFGAHLPLSTNFKEVGKHGTRHSAALGLSEQSDVLCIVVSEEKGKVSYCLEGRMKRLKDLSELEKVLNKYIREKFVTKSEGRLKEFVKQDLPFKASAVLVAGLLWFFTAYKAGIVEQTFEIPIEINKLPKEVVIESYSPKSIQVAVTGRGDTAFSEISSEDFTINFDNVKLESGVSKVDLSAKDIVLPPNINLVSYTPDSFLVTAQKYYAAKIPVTVKTKGSIPWGHSLQNVTVTPDAIELWIPDEQNPPQELLTEIIDISGQTESVIIPAKIIVPEGSRIVNGDATLNVALTIE